MKKSFKRFAAILLGLALLATSATVAFAEDEDKSVTFNGETLTADYKDVAVRQEVFTMQPGDTTNIDIELRNDVGSSATWYISNEVLQSLEESNGAKDGAYTYRLVYNPGQTDEQVLFESQRVGGTGSGGASRSARAGSSTAGLNEINENLAGYQFLATLPAGGRGRVQLTVELDGETQGTDYGNSLARLQMSFAVDPVAQINRTETVTNRVNRDVTTVVQTGEGSDRLPFVLATGISGLLLLLLGILGLMDGRKAKKAAQKAVCLALALTFACAAPAMMGNVARADDGTYILRVFNGLHGTVKPSIAAASVGGVAYTLTAIPITDGYKYEVPANAKVTLDWGAKENVDLVGTDNGKYIVQGVRLSGTETIVQSSFTMDKDMDYVVAYGVNGSPVSYTIRYVDTEGNQLLDPVTRTGKVGDRPVVPYRDIAGYLPQAYNLTRTLVSQEEADEDVTKNVFTFTYTPIPENVTTEMLTELLGGGVVVIPGAAPAGGGGAPAGPGGVVVPEEETPLAPPEEVIDLDNPETPQAGPGQSGALEDLTDNATPLSGLPMAAKVGIGVAAAAVLGGAAFLIVKKRKKNNAEAS